MQYQVRRASKKFEVEASFQQVLRWSLVEWKIVWFSRSFDKTYSSLLGLAHVGQWPVPASAVGGLKWQGFIVPCQAGTAGVRSLMKKVQLQGRRCWVPTYGAATRKPPELRPLIPAGPICSRLATNQTALPTKVCGHLADPATSKTGDDGDDDVK